MNKGLAAADYIILVGFFLVMLAIGITYARRMKNLSDFFSGGGQVPWWLSGISLYMTTFSAFTFVSYSALAYKFGFVAVTTWWFSIPGCLLSAWYLAGRWRRAATTSPVEYLETRYSPFLRQLFSWFGIPLIVLDDALKLFVIGTMITASVGLEDPTSRVIAIVGAGLIMLLYTLMGGLWAVLITDFVQFIVMAAAVLVLAPLAAIKAGGVLSVIEKLPEGYGNMTNASYSWPWLLSFSVILALTFATKWPYVQRYYAANSDRDARWVGYTVAFFTFIGPPILFWPAIAATQFLPDVADPNTIYPMICRLLLPVGMMGVVLAAMFSATMSMLSSDYNALSSVITNDIIKRLFRPNASDRELVFLARASTFLVGGIAMVLAVVLVYRHDLENLVDVMAKLFAVLLPPVAIPMAAGLLSDKVSERGALSAFVLGSVFGVGAFVTGGDADFSYLRTLPWLTWLTILPALAGLVGGSLIWPNNSEQRARIDAFLHGLAARSSRPVRRDRTRDGLYALYIIGMTCLALGSVMIVAVVLTAPAAGLVTMAVGGLFIVGGGAAAWHARRHTTRLTESGGE